MSERIKKFFNSWEYKTLRIILTTSLLIVTSIWATQVMEYNRILTETNLPEFERCFYLKCETDMLGGLRCYPEYMLDGEPSYLWKENFTSWNLTIRGIER